MKGTLYFWIDGDVCQHIVWNTESHNWMYQSEERAKKYIAEKPYFNRWAMKKEFDTYCMDRAKKRLETAFSEGNFKYIFECLKWNQNTYSRKAFYELTGNKLSDTMKIRIEQLKELYKEEWEKLGREKEQEKKEEQERAYKAIEDKFIRGEDITNGEFITLCNKHNIDIPARTKGYINKYLVSINISGSYTKYGKTKSNNLGWIFSQLKDKFEEEEDDCKELFNRKEK